jgi:transposase-like protein
MNIKLSHTDKKEIVAELQSGNVTRAELAAKYGVHPGTISLTFKKMTGNGLKRHLSQIERKAIVAELQSGNVVTIKEVATKYSVHSRTIDRVYKSETGKTWIPKPRLSTQEAKNGHNTSQVDVALLLTKLTQEIPDRNIIYDLKNQKIS